MPVAVLRFFCQGGQTSGTVVTGHVPCQYYDATGGPVVVSLIIILGAAAAGVGWYLWRLANRIAQQDRRIAALTRRVWALEENSTPAAVAPEDEMQHTPAVAPAPRPADFPRVTRSDRAEDWETRVGANWLNRLGAAVLVIGFALFFGYSLTQFGAWGKVLIGIAAGISLLTAGISLARNDLYRTYAYSLMGAGWAVTFFTTYAAHAVPEARLIESSFAGTAALVVVTALMIAHSIYYRSESATALACLLGITGLNVSPLTSASVVATLLLALSLTGISYRFGWIRLPLLGVALTYLAFLFRYGIADMSGSSMKIAQAILWTYWITFEGYDLLTLRRTPGSRSVFLLNACGFAGALSLLQWKVNSGDWSIFFGLASLAYLASSILRARMTASGESGGYEFAAIASSLLMARALVERFTGVAFTMAMLVEGELVFLTGAWLGSRWIRRTGEAVLLLACLQLIFADFLGGTPARKWTPTAALMTGGLWINRRLAPGTWYLTLAGALVALVTIQAEVTRLWIAPLWAAGGVLAIVFGKAEIPWLGAAALAVSVTRAVIVNSDRDVLTTAIVVAAAYAGQFLWSSSQQWVRMALSALGTTLLTLLISERVQGRLLTMCLGAEGAVLLSAGFLLRERVLRLSGLGLFLFCIGKLFVHDLRELDTLSRILSFLVLGVVLMAASWVYTRYRDKVRRLL